MHESTKSESEIEAIDILIIDEISMCRLDLFDFIARKVGLANIKRKENGKKAIQFIISGDFFQLPPVLVPSEKEILDKYYGYDIGEAFPFQSKYWKAIGFKNIMLTEIVRQSDNNYAMALRGVKYGN